MSVEPARIKKYKNEKRRISSFSFRSSCRITYRSLRGASLASFGTLTLRRSCSGVKWDTIERGRSLAALALGGTQVATLALYFGDGDLKHRFHVGDSHRLVGRLVKGVRNDANHDKESDKVGKASEDRTGVWAHGCKRWLCLGYVCRFCRD